MEYTVIIQGYIGILEKWRLPFRVLGLVGNKGIYYIGLYRDFIFVCLTHHP